MSNTFTALAPVLFTAAKEVAEEATGALQSVNVDVDNKGVALGDTLKVPVAPVAVESTYTPAMAVSAGSDKVAAAVAVTIDFNKQTSWHLTGEQLLSLKNANSDKDWVRQLIKQGMRTLRNAAEVRLCAEIYKNASRATGTAGTTPFSTSLDVIADVQQIFTDNGSNLSDASLIINSSAMNNAQKLSVIQSADQAGSDEERREGTILNQFGFKVKVSKGITSHTKGTATGMDCTAVEPVGETTIAMDGSNSGTVLPGDVVTNDTDADTNKYVVKSGSTLTGNASGNMIINNPGLIAVTEINDEFIIGDSYTANIAFERNAVVAVIRPPIIPPSPIIKQILISDPRGFTYLLVEAVGDGMITWRLHLCYGFKVISPEFVAILMG